MQSLLRAAGLDRGQHPGRLDKACGQSTGTSPGGPGAVPFAAACGAERGIECGHRNEERALEAESDRMSEAKLLDNSLREVGRPRAVVIRDRSGIALASGPSEVPRLHRSDVSAKDDEVAHQLSVSDAEARRVTHRHHQDVSAAGVARYHFVRAAVVPVLLTGCGRGGQRERAALRVPADGPAIAGMDDRATELADAFECRGHVSHGEVGQGGGVAGARSTLVDSEAQVVGVGLPPRSGRGGPWRKGDPKDSVPEPAGANGIIGRKLNQRRGHGREYDRGSRSRLVRGEGAARSRMFGSPRSDPAPSAGQGSFAR